ncbi:aminotransferase class III-fold pyridoxal phosphate-dependent enzyme [Hyphococcus luteus]|uniref:Aspartate aminotransferase family protein n=1 Tax=Hyphococcus luteus TaxID=2058213 RepID=A0A2S7K4P2_9PROT|nr:aminotransferase class III-fold pyridoxal phosphate-dependent enzyme [Marinicaulis flavus]PQA87473.1 aspartate aminotransferase family protein [Marinicaulis flavus]
MTSETQPPRNDWLQSYWMPFTPNKAFKASPRIYESAEGFYYKTSDGRKILDSFSGLWCCNLGHRHPKISEAIKAQVDELDYSNAFNFGHPKVFELANVIAGQFPGDLDHVFFVNSGSEAADTALKIAIAYQRLRGEGTRTRLIGRVNGYHGVGFGGISVGGMVNNRKFFGSLLPGVDHLSFPYDSQRQSFTRGEPDADVEPYMQQLEEIIALHDASTIAAVIVEPFAGSGGVFIPPKNYLKRLREVTKKHGILLIVDEVISGFGRMAAPNAATHYGVEPDIVTVAKAINNGSVPMGAAIVRKQIYDVFMEEMPAGVEFFHGYTYSGHPLAAAASLAAQEVFRTEGVYENTQALAPYFEEGVHSLKDEPNVIDIRNVGLAAGVTVAAKDGAPGARGGEVFLKTYEEGVAVRANGDHLAVAPILTMGRAEIDMTIEALRKGLRAAA